MRGLLLVACVIVALDTVLWHAPAAQACLYEEGYNPVRGADLIVEGIITSWEKTPARTPQPESDILLDIRVSMDVEGVLKGSAPSPLQFLEPARLETFNGTAQWSIVNDCVPGFQPDRVGKYAIIGLSKAGDDTLKEHTYFFLGSGPTDTHYNQALARIDELRPDFPRLPAAIVAVAGPLAFLVGGGVCVGAEGGRGVSAAWVLR